MRAIVALVGMLLGVSGLVRRVIAGSSGGFFVVCIRTVDCDDITVHYLDLLVRLV
jgi:hypothetical protein